MSVRPRRAHLQRLSADNVFSITLSSQSFDRGWHVGAVSLAAESPDQPATQYRLVIATRLKAFITVASQVTAEIWSAVSAAAAVL